MKIKVSLLIFFTLVIISIGYCFGKSIEIIKHSSSLMKMTEDYVDIIHNTELKNNTSQRINGYIFYYLLDKDKDQIQDGNYSFSLGAKSTNKFRYSRLIESRYLGEIKYILVSIWNNGKEVCYKMSDFNPKTY